MNYPGGPNMITAVLNSGKPWDFPGSPVVLPIQRAKVPSLARELDPTCFNKDLACHD